MTTLADFRSGVHAGLVLGSRGKDPLGHWRVGHEVSMTEHHETELPEGFASAAAAGRALARFLAA